MKSRVFRILFGVVALILSSTPVGVSAERDSREAWADFIVPAQEEASASECFSSDQQPLSQKKEGVFTSGDALAGEPIGEEPTNPEPKEDSKRHNNSNGNSAGFRALAEAANTYLYNTTNCPATRRGQDAQQERAKMIRFLHHASDIC